MVFRPKGQKQAFARLVQRGGKGPIFVPMKRYLIVPVACLLTLAACSPSAEGPVDLRWDYSAEQTWTYAFSQHSTSLSTTTLMTEDDEPFTDTTRYQTRAKGDLLVVSHGDGTASWTIEGLQLTAVDLDPSSGTPLDSGTQDIPPLQSADRDDAGFLVDEQTDENVLFAYLFSLPVVSLSRGETIIDSVALPMPALGVPLPLRSVRSIRFAGMEKRQGIHCAKLQTTFTVRASDLPPEFQDAYKLSRTGQAVGWFDLEAGHYVESEVTLSSTVDFDAGPAVGRMQVDSEDRFTVRFTKP